MVGGREWPHRRALLEATATGRDMKVRVIYDENDRLKSAEFIEGQKAEANENVGSDPSK